MAKTAKHTTRRRRSDLSTNVGPAAVKDRGIAGIQGSEGLERNKEQPPHVEVGTSGLYQFSGIIFQEPLIEWRGREAYKRADEMRRNSPIISGLILAIENPIRSTAWEFASDDGSEDPRLDLLDRAIRNMEHTLNDHVSEALTMLPFGYSIFEMCFEQVGGEWLWKKLAPRAQNTVLRWIYEDVHEDADPSGPTTSVLRGFVQLAPPKFKQTPLPIEKLFIYRIHTELDNPEGRSILRPGWVPYYYVKHLQQVEAIGAERNLAGLPVIYLPPGASTDPDASSDASVANKLVRNIRNDEQAGLVLPDAWHFELVRSGGGSGAASQETDKIISRHTKDILTSCLAQFLMLGQQGIGSMALSKDQTDFFTMSVNAVADIIAETFTKHVIPALMKLNGYPSEGLRIEHTPAQGEMGIQILSAVLKDAGPYLHWTPEDEIWLRQAIGMPEKDIDELKQIWANRQEQIQVANAAAAAKQQEPVQEGGGGSAQAGAKPGTQSPAGNSGPATGQQDEGPDIRMAADLYAVQQAEDKATRDRLETEMRKAMQKFLQAQKRRVMKAVK